MKSKKFFASAFFLLLPAFGFQLLSSLHAEDVKITTYYPSPYGSYKHLSIDDGASSTTSYGSLQINREETNHFGSHLAFLRNKSTPIVMGLGYQRNSDTFGFGPGVNSTSGEFDPTSLSIDSAGNVGIGTNDPKAILDVVSDGGAILVPRKSSTGNPTGVNGMIYYNTADKKFLVYQDGGWVDMVSSTAEIIANPILAAPVWVRVGNDVLFGSTTSSYFFNRFTFAVTGSVQQVKLTVTSRNDTIWPAEGTVFSLTPPTFTDGWESSAATWDWIEFTTQNPGNGTQLSVIAHGADYSGGVGWIKANVDVSYT